MAVLKLMIGLIILGFCVLFVVALGDIYLPGVQNDFLISFDGVVVRMNESIDFVLKSLFSGNLGDFLKWFFIICVVWVILDWAWSKKWF